MTRPVTNTQYFFGDEVLVSETDLHGTILYANEAFATASGYSKKELLGQPHNILRHPDMPAEAFKDMWRSLQLGLPWSGLVKNRRKNGDYYWVMARAAPVYEGGEVVRYLSVRYAPPESLIRKAEENYARLKQGKRKLLGGCVAHFWQKCPLFKARAGEVLGVFAAVVASLGLVSWAEIVTVEVGHFIGITALFSGLIGWKLYQNSQRLGLYSTALSYLIEGGFNHDVSFDSLKPFASTDKYDRIGALIGIAQSNLARIQDESNALLCEGNRNTTAINSASVGLMIADNDHVIQYANPSVLNILKRHEKTLQKYLPDFQVESIVGSHMDIFHKAPLHQQQLVENLKEPMTTRLHLDEMILELKIVPIVEGTRHGTVVEWMDMSDINQVEEEIKKIVVSVEQGLFYRRIENLEIQDPVLSTVVQELNKMMNVLDNFINDAGSAIGQLAFSQINKEMVGQYQGAFRSLQNSANLSFSSLNEMVGQVQFNANQVNHATKELSSGVNSFSDKLQQQASAIEQTSAAMHQMAEYVQENTANVNYANQLGQGVLEKVNYGSEVMQQAVEAMQAIQASGQQINDITSVIDGLAFQTNLLALNAAVEAARAGEHGRGFAVVAGEVGLLAQKSAEAAKDIQGLISTSVQQIAKGTDLVALTGDELVQIKESVASMSRLVAEVSNASQEQETRIIEVNKTIRVMDEVAQQSAALVEQTAATSTHVAGQVNELESLVRVFELGEVGQKVKNRGRTPLAEYKQAHFNWRIRMANVVSGHEMITDISTVQNHHLCGLGKWRNSEGMRFNHLPEMQQLDEVHEAFHHKVAQAIEMKNFGDIEGAYIAIQEVEAMSFQVVELLEKIEQYIAHSGEENPKHQTHDLEFQQPCRCAEPNHPPSGNNLAQLSKAASLSFEQEISFKDF